MTEKRLPPVHPGEVLLEEFLKPLGLSRNRLGLSAPPPDQRDRLAQELGDRGGGAAGRQLARLTPRRSHRG